MPRRFLDTNGRMRHAPDWFWLLQDAREWHLDPWTLAGIPETADPTCMRDWRRWISWTRQAEVMARQKAERQARARGPRSR